MENKSFFKLSKKPVPPHESNAWFAQVREGINHGGQFHPPPKKQINNFSFVACSHPENKVQTEDPV